MKPVPVELSAKLDEIKSWMFHGDMISVANKARVDKSVVSRMLNKQIAPPKRVLDAAIEVMNENKARFECSQKMKVA